MIKLPNTAAPPTASSLSSDYEESSSEEEVQLYDEVEDARQGLGSWLGFFCIISLLGVLLGLGWRYSGVAHYAEQLRSLVTFPPKTVSAKPADLELNALKKEIGNLTATNQQMAATISALQTRQQELEHRLLSPYSESSWYSDPKLLQMHIVAVHRPLPVRSKPNSTTSASRPEARNKPPPATPSSPPLLLTPQN
jgi:hypothetical protein